ncbi:Ankyrin repeat and KH domain-containing protein mask [Gryllus bimaculatus]|nr:Ankyrin repeat and KH domain-containing protein mask [Gryllus bimaculatus]
MTKIIGRIPQSQHKFTFSRQTKEEANFEAVHHGGGDVPGEGAPCPILRPERASAGRVPPRACNVRGVGSTLQENTQKDALPIMLERYQIGVKRKTKCQLVTSITQRFIAHTRLNMSSVRINTRKGTDKHLHRHIKEVRSDSMELRKTNSYFSQAVGKQKRHVVLHTLHQREGVLKLLFSFSTETANEVAGKRDARKDISHVIHKLQICCTRVAPPHALQYMRDILNIMAACSSCISQTGSVEEADVNAKDNKGATPLHKACTAGHVECVRELTRRGADVNAKNSNEWTPLHIASKGGHVECVQELLRSGADVNAKENNGATPLHKACNGGHVECVRELIGRGADVNAKNNDGATPLHRAANGGQVECLRELLGRGADVNAKNNNGATPLHRASNGGHVNCVRELLVAGASAAERNNGGKTPLDLSSNDEVRRAFDELYS